MSDTATVTHFRSGNPPKKGHKTCLWKKNSRNAPSNHVPGVFLRLWWPKRLQNGAPNHEHSMRKRRRTTHRTNHGKNIKQSSEHLSKIDEKTMKNQCRNGRRRRDEKRTLEV